MSTVFYIVISLVLAGMRIGGISHSAFQAAAHLFLGWLCAMWFERPQERKFFRVLIIGLVVVEVSCAFWFHFNK